LAVCLSLLVLADIAHEVLQPTPDGFEQIV